METWKQIIRCQAEWIASQLWFFSREVSCLVADKITWKWRLFSLFLSSFSGGQRILGYVRPWRIVALHPAKTGKRRSICGLHLDEPLDWDSLLWLWRNWPSNAPLKDAASVSVSWWFQLIASRKLMPSEWLAIRRNVSAKRVLRTSDGAFSSVMVQLSHEDAASPFHISLFLSTQHSRRDESAGFNREEEGCNSTALIMCYFSYWSSILAVKWCSSFVCLHQGR